MQALKELSPLFEQMYSELGRPSIPPERLLKASLLMALYTVRSERMLCEQLEYNLLFRWFLDLNWDEPGFQSDRMVGRHSLLRVYQGSASWSVAYRVLASSASSSTSTQIASFHFTDAK